MSRAVTEYMNGGVVTARPGWMLQPGEIQRGDDCIYRDKDPAIWRAPGRVNLNFATLGASSPVKGLKFCPFAKHDSQLLAYVGTKVYTGPANSSTFASGSMLFNEVSGAGSVAGSVSSTTFTATTGAPFTADAVGTIVHFISASASVTAVARVTAVGSPSGNYYATLTFDVAPGGGTCTIALDRGVSQTLADNATTGIPSVNEILGGVFYGSTYFLWLGNGVPYRLEWRALTTTSGSAGTEALCMRPVGLDPVTQQFSLTLLSGTIPGGGTDTYAWPASLGIGVYWFVLTEIYGRQDEHGQDIDIAEGAYLAQTEGQSNVLQAGKPIAINVTALTNGVRLTTPNGGAVNNGGVGKLATHWGVYMSTATTDASTPPDISTFRRVRRAAIAEATTTTKYGESQNIDIYDASSTQGWMYPNTTTAAADGKVEWTNAANMLGKPDTNSVGVSTSGYTEGGVARDAADFLGSGALWTCEQTGAAFITASPWSTRPVSGVSIRVRGYSSFSFLPGSTLAIGGEYYVYLVSATGKKSNISFGNLSPKTDTHYHGGPGDPMGVAWTAAEFAAGFKLCIAKKGTEKPQKLFIDSVGVLVHWGTTVTRGVPYRIVTYRDQVGTTASDPAALAPGGCTTGDFFRGSLVINDANNETALHWSLPGDIECWPKPYQIVFNTGKKDKITYIRSVNASLLVGMEESIKRVNYLPSENDTDLTTGLAQEDVVSDHGIAGPNAAARFDLPGGGQMVIYAGSAGCFLTDAITVRPVNMDIDWANTVKLSALSTSIFKVYPKEKLIAFYYCPAGATHNLNTRVLYFSYQQDKVKDGGMLPMIGPCVVQARSAAEAFLNGTSYLLTGAENNGNIYLEDSGLTVPSGYRVRLTDDSGNGDGKAAINTDVKIVPLIRTRKWRANGIDNDMAGEKVYLQFTAYGSNSVTATATRTVNSTTVLSSAAFGSVLPGMRLIGAGYDPGTIVLAKASSSSITISRAANATGSGTVTFDTGTIGVSVRGNRLGDAVKGLRHHYVSTLVGDLVSVVSTDVQRGLELQFEKVPLTFDGNGDTATWADLSTAMQLQSFTYMIGDSGLPDTNRNSA